MLSSNAMLWYSLETARWGWCWLVGLLVLLCFFLSRTVSCSFLSLITNSWLNTLKNREGFAFALLAWLCCKRSSWREGGETSSTIETDISLRKYKAKKQTHVNSAAACSQPNGRRWSQTQDWSVAQVLLAALLIDSGQSLHSIPLCPHMGTLKWGQ